MDLHNKIVHFESVAKSGRCLMYDDASNKIYCNNMENERILEEPCCLWKVSC